MLSDPAASNLKPMPLSHYVRTLKPEVPDAWFEPVPARLGWLLLYGGLAAGGILWIVLGAPTVLASLGLSLIIGWSFGGLAFMGHELVHGSVVRNRRLQMWLASFCYLPFNLGPLLWRHWHNGEHHGNTQHFEDDPDAMATLEQYRERPELQWIYRLAPVMRSILTFWALTWWFSFHSFKMFLRFHGDFPTPRRRLAWVQLLVPVTIWCLLLVVAGPVKFLFAYLIPLTIGNFIVMSYIATNHMLNPLADENDPLVASLTVRNPRIIEILHLNFSHHSEHHVFPRMSPRYAPLLTEKIMEHWPERYHALPHWQALLALWRTPRIYSQSDRLIDPERNLEYPVLGHGLDPLNVTVTSAKQEADTSPAQLSDRS